MKIHRAYLGGLGDVPASCGANPCGAWDYVYVSDECQTYLACAGLPPMTFSGQLGAGLKSITSGTANVLGQGTQGLFSNPITDVVLALAALVVVGILVAGKR